jgi:hypothetical protein
MLELEPAIQAEGAAEQPSADVSAKNTPPQETVQAADVDPINTQPPIQEPPPKEHHVPVKALTEERRKRQQAQQYAQQLEARLSAIEARVQQPDKVIASDEEFLQDIPGAFTKAEERFNKRMQAQLDAQRYAMSEAQARAMYQDYDDALTEYADMARANPSLAQRVAQSAHPSLEMYQLVQLERKAREQGQSSEKDLERRIAEEVQRRMQEYMSQNGTPPPAVSPAAYYGTINTARGGNGAAPQQWAGPTPMQDIFNRRR